MKIFPQDLSNAVDQLNCSDKGKKSLGHIRAFLHDCGCSLDSQNQRAVLTLLSGAFGEYPGTVLDLLDGEQPSVDDTVHCCPNCERPNQFGEVCPECERERALNP